MNKTLTASLKELHRDTNINLNLEQRTNISVPEPKKKFDLFHFRQQKQWLQGRKTTTLHLHASLELRCQIRSKNCGYPQNTKEKTIVIIFLNLF